MTNIWSLALYASRVLCEDMEQLLGDQQFSTASFIAAEISDDLDDRFSVLAKVAARVAPAMLGHVTTLQIFLEDRVMLDEHFDAVACITGIDATTIADVPLMSGRLGVNCLDRDYLVAVLRDGKATICRQFIGKAMKGPVFIMAVPICDSRG